MSEQEINIKKELARVKMAERNRLLHRKKARRKIEIAKAKIHKVERTAKRCSENTMDELLAISDNIKDDEFKARLGDLLIKFKPGPGPGLENIGISLQ